MKTHFFFHVLVHICISDHGELVTTNWGDIHVCHCAAIFLKQEDLALLEICCSCASVQTKLVGVCTGIVEVSHRRCELPVKMIYLVGIEDDLVTHCIDISCKRSHLLGSLSPCIATCMDETRVDVSDPAAASG